ncbi:MAG: gliding motility protein GldC [Chitinophagaceae bacterium]
MNTSTIQIEVTTDEQRIPAAINWRASDAADEKMQNARALLLSIWDPADKAALRIDLWTKEMMVDEMADFFYQTLMTMADTYGRATQYADQVEEMKEFAKSFYAKFREKQLQQNKA